MPMIDIENLFSRLQPDWEKLRRFGFVQVSNDYIYETALPDGQFAVRITVAANGTVKADVIDSATGEIYVLVKVSAATGPFVGKIRSQFDQLVNDVSRQCFFPNAFKSEATAQVLAYVQAKYGSEPEFLWEKFPGNAILRRPDNAKWYAALLRVPAYKIGVGGEECIDIIDLRVDPQSVDSLIDGRRYFPGYHMNKKHWITICLDGLLPVEEICRCIDESYCLAAAAAKKRVNRS